MKRRLPTAATLAALFLVFVIASYVALFAFACWSWH